MKPAQKHRYDTKQHKYTNKTLNKQNKNTMVSVSSSSSSSGGGGGGGGGGNLQYGFRDCRLC
jgi:uncharacterized membrane protein